MGMRSLTKGVCIKSLTMRASGEMKLGHCDFQIRTEASELGHYRVAACADAQLLRSSQAPCAEYPICLGRDACVLYAAERAGNALYGARVDLEFGRRLAHAHAPRAESGAARRSSGVLAGFNPL
jgi:hypothetical protein